jgi:alpha-tubulin suppressor-like RCC1 family protein
VHQGVVLRSILTLLVSLWTTGCLEAPPPSATFPLLDDLGNGDWSQVSTGRDHTCALTTAGRAYCWGSNLHGQLGVSAAGLHCGASRTPCILIPVAVETALRFRTISAGAAHTCAIAIDRAAYCWGDNSTGALGDVVAGGPLLVRVPGAYGVIDVSAGFNHSCALRTDGTALCWGSNNRGQLGTGDTIPSAVPRRVADAPPMASISAGQWRTCGRTVSSVVYCWGGVWLYRQNGLEYTVSQPRARPVPNAPSFSTITVGTFTTCGTDADGNAYCWEANPFGEMGNSTTEGSTVPVRVAGIARFVAVSAGIIQSCGIATTGAGYCWGNDTFGQLGVSPDALGEQCATVGSPCSTAPIPVFGRQEFVSMSTGLGNHSCGVTTRGNLYCWGLGVWGQRGDGTASYREVIPIQIRRRAG